MNKPYDANAKRRTSGLGKWPLALAAAVLAGCAGASGPGNLSDSMSGRVRAAAVARSDESAMLPLLTYLQRLQRMSAQELLRERNVLTVTAPTPAAHVRMAGVLGQPRGPLDLNRALALLDGVLKSNEPAAVSVHPLARILAVNYQERQKLQMHNDKLSQQLGESLARSTELQEKLDALTAIERSLPVRPTGEAPPGSAR